MRLKRKFRYEVRELGPINALLKNFRTRDKAKRYARARGLKFIWTIRYRKRRGTWWIAEKPTIAELEGMLIETVTLHAKNLSDQYIKSRDSLAMAAILGLDQESLRSIFENGNEKEP